MKGQIWKHVLPLIIQPFRLHIGPGLLKSIILTDSRKAILMKSLIIAKSLNTNILSEYIWLLQE